MSDWEHGSRGWIVRVSIAIMLIDTVIKVLSITAIILRELFVSKSSRSWRQWLGFWHIVKDHCAWSEISLLIRDQQDATNEYVGDV